MRRTPSAGCSTGSWRRPTHRPCGRTWPAAGPCAAELRQVETARSWVRGLPAVDPPFGFYERLLDTRRRRRWAAAAMVAAAAASVAFVGTLPAREAPVKPAVANLIRTHAVTASVDGDPVSRLATAGVPVSFRAVKSLIGAAALAVIVEWRVRPVRVAADSETALDLGPPAGPSGIVLGCGRRGVARRQGERHRQLTVEGLAGGVLLFGGPTPLMALDQARLVRQNAAWDVLWPAAFGSPEPARQRRRSTSSGCRSVPASLGYETVIVDIRRGEQGARAFVCRALQRAVAPPRAVRRPGPHPAIGWVPSASKSTPPRRPWPGR